MSATTDATQLHRALLRCSILHILRAAGFTRTRPAVLDTIVDLAARYLILLAYHTAQHAQQPYADPAVPLDTVTITDLRLALQDVGALYPQISETEEEFRGEEDMRGVEAFIRWCTGSVNAEIRRIAGMSGAGPAVAAAKASIEGVKQPVPSVAVAVAETEALLEADGREDYLTVLKKKHSKTGEESRWQGTVLGKDSADKEIEIEGWDVQSMEGWHKKLFAEGTRLEASVQASGEVHDASASGNSSPLSDIEGSGIESGFD